VTAAFLLFHDGKGTERSVELPRTGERLTIGRLPGNDITLDWDTDVSRLHAALERAGSAWTLIDSGLSRKGCYVNNTRVLGRHRLHNGDLLRFGSSVVTYIERDDAPLAERKPAARHVDRAPNQATT
jgi:pSer/pThr/pTyr-binding forkhead associated (FHA) protein